MKIKDVLLALEANDTIRLPMEYAAAYLQIEGIAERFTGFRDTNAVRRLANAMSKDFRLSIGCILNATLRNFASSAAAWEEVREMAGQLANA